MKRVSSSCLDARGHLCLLSAVLAAILSMFAFHTAACAANGQTIDDAAQAGELIQEVPTLKCLSVRWLIGGDGNADAQIVVNYRPLGLETWKRGLDLFRIETASIHEQNRPAAGQTLFAVSIFSLQKDTQYEVKLSLHDPDGGPDHHRPPRRPASLERWADPCTTTIRQAALRDAPNLVDGFIVGAGLDAAALAGIGLHFAQPPGHLAPAVSHHHHLAVGDTDKLASVRRMRIASGLSVDLLS